MSYDNLLAAHGLRAGCDGGRDATGYGGRGRGRGRRARTAGAGCGCGGRRGGQDTAAIAFSWFLSRVAGVFAASHGSTKERCFEYESAVNFCRAPAAAIAWRNSGGISTTLGASSSSRVTSTS